MKIVYLCHRTPYPPNKGERIRTFHQIEYLHRRGHEVFVFAPISGDEDLLNLRELEAHYCTKALSGKAPKRTALLLSLLKGEALSVGNFYSKQLQGQLDQFLATTEADAVVCTSSSMADYVFRSKSIDISGPRPCLIMDFMDLDSDKWRQYSAIKGFPLNLIYQREAKLIQQLERRIHQSFDSCLFISQAEVDLFLSSNPDLGKLQVIANGLDTNTFKPCAGNKPSSGPNLLFTGVMDYLPNEDAVVWFADSAWATLKQRHPDATFFIAGMNPSPKVMALANKPGIVVTGFVDDIVQYYDQAHIFIAPFRLARGVQNKVLQAFACGLPTITTPMGCEGIDCSHGNEVIVADTIDEMLNQIDWLIEHPEAARQIGDKAMKLIHSEFSWEGKLADFERILQFKSTT